MRGLSAWRIAGLAGLAAGGLAVLGLGIAGWVGTAVGVLGLLIVLGLLWTVKLLTGIQHTLTGLRSGQRDADQAMHELARALEAQQGVVREGQRTLSDRLDTRHKETVAAVRAAARQLIRQQRDQTQQVEALLQLFAGLDPRAPMPSSGHWALNPTELLELWSVLEQRRPCLALELGSGVSSVWLGYALERHGGRLVSVDHDPDYAELTREQLRRHGLTAVVEVRVAPLRPVTVAGEPFPWYDLSSFHDLSDIELMLVDGPPGGTGPLARYPALPLLRERLGPDPVVVLDDADRADEQEILRRWTEEPGLRRQPGTVGHLAVLRSEPSAAPATAA